MQKAPRFEELQGAELAGAIGELFRWRLRMAPAGITVAVLIVALEPVLWRKITVVLVAIAMLVLSIVELRKVRREPSAASVSLTFNGVAVTTLHAFGVAVTGGVDSPILLSVAILTLLMALLLPRGWGFVTAGIQVVSILAMTVAGMARVLPATPGFLGGGALSSPAAVAVRGTIAVFFVFAALRVGHRVRTTFEAVGQRAVRARDESLASFESETRTITTMAGEIAHELKNPLATVKGLAQLVAKDTEGKNAERMRVLRREVDRMQGILEEFLNFSRPLVPLSQEEVRLERLCIEVALLHESVALERRVTISVTEATDVTARCDARKVKQILINLLQNALAVSPGGSTIVIGLATESSDGEPVARVTVRDEGPGLPESIAERIFQPGVTTKAGGSGLGLTVSRALARQHGGELALRSTAKGCTGELILPRAGVAQPVAMATP